MDKMEMSVSKTFYTGQNRDVYLENQMNKKPKNKKGKKGSMIHFGSDDQQLETTKQKYDNSITQRIEPNP